MSTCGPFNSKRESNEELLPHCCGSGKRWGETGGSGRRWGRDRGGSGRRWGETEVAVVEGWGDTEVAVVGEVGIINKAFHIHQNK